MLSHLVKSVLRLGLILTFLAASGICAWAAKPAPPSDGAGTLTGKVTIAGTRTAIAAATVSASGNAGTFIKLTDSKGSYSLSLPAGNYTVTASAPGYSAQTFQAAIKTGSKTVLNFALSEAITLYGTLSGTVVDALTSEPLAGALVSTDSGGYDSLTDNLGRFSMTVIAGNYALSAKLSGYQDLTQNVSVQANQTLTTDFALTPLAPGLSILEISATPDRLLEGQAQAISLKAKITGTASAYEWHQVSGPKVPLSALSAVEARADVSSLEVAAECDLVFELRLNNDGAAVSASVRVPVEPVDIVQYPAPHVQIGGASTAVARFEFGGEIWSIFNIGTALKALPVRMQPGDPYEIILPAFARDIEVISHNGGLYALIAAGDAGVVVVDIGNPAAMRITQVLPVNYLIEGVTFTETGGSILYDNIFASSASHIVALASDGVDLYLANPEFGIHKTALANVFSNIRETDGTLKIDSEARTVQYAGEHPWGGPLDLSLFGGRLFAGMGVLGLGIFDPNTLEQIGRYNLYTDEARTEDYFGDMAASQAVAADPATGEPYLDAFTGMPDYRQVNYEILVVMKGTGSGEPTPWADLERKGKWYYEAIGVDVAQQGSRTIVYLAYSLGGLVAVDVSGYESATAAMPLQGYFLGFFPAVPANGPFDTLSSPSSLLPYEGAGKLKESGVTAVEVQGERVYLTDHFAGLVILNQASTPELWQGIHPPYNNDTDGIPGNHVPDFENIVSYDMSPWDPLDNESLPWAFYQPPCELATRELNGHGYTLALMEEIIPDAPGQVDVLECSSGGGFVFVDITDLTAAAMSERFAIVHYVPTTDEIGAAADGSATQTIALGHTDGISATDDYIYISDGPHGVSAWKITDADGYPTDQVHLVANTLQDEYPVEVNGELIYPASHTVRNVIDPARQTAWSLCVGNGLRRVPIGAVEQGAGQAWTPLLIKLHIEDSYEHNGDWGVVKKFNYQDQAYDVEFLGNLAFVADGSNGLTLYDVSKNPTLERSGFFVGNIGYNQGKPLLGTASGVELWQDTSSGKRYAILASGPSGVGVVDVTDVNAMKLVKVFEPIKYENEEIGSADGQAIDVEVIGDKAYFTYDSFGVLCYALKDLIAPLPADVDPTDLFKKEADGTVIYDYRPEFLGRFKLQWVEGQEDVSGGAVKMAYVEQDGKLIQYVAFGEAGVVKIDYTNPAQPRFIERIDTAGESVAVAIANGRLYIGDHAGGLVLYK